MIDVLKPGLLDLVMDLGRPGYASIGVPQGGAADALALRLANRLAGNPDQGAGLEMLVRGPTLCFPHGAHIALTGADMEAKVDGKSLRANHCCTLAPGARLEFGAARSGLRAYLAVRGGIDVPLVMGSRATFLPGGWGGWFGRALRAGDSLPVGAETTAVRLIKKTASSQTFTEQPTLRVMAGPQIAGFSDGALSGFLSRPYVVLAQSNRMGLRLGGPRLIYEAGELPAQGVLPGAVQVPPDGQPVILGWDGPVTGGYPVVAGVIAADMHLLAQARPGNQLLFRFVGEQEALTAWHDVMGQACLS